MSSEEISGGARFRIIHQRPALIAAWWSAACLALMGCFCCAAAEARTIELDIDDCTGAATISADAPRLSWAGDGSPLTFYTTLWASATPAQSILVRYDLSRIPRGVRITSAHWIMPLYGRQPDECRFFIWRVLADWGPGVCHLYRRTLPDSAEWSRPGGTASGVDRAIRPIIVDAKAIRDEPVNVTRDVQTWYHEPATNQGWMISVEDQGTLVRFRSPIGAGRDHWKLRITYEPE